MNRNECVVNSNSSSKQRHEVVIVHNCWIHYKDMLFRKLESRGLDFLVYFVATHARQEFQGQTLQECPYNIVSGFDGAYEGANQLKSAVTVWRLLSYTHPLCLVIGGWYNLTLWSAWAWGITHGVRMILWAESNGWDRKHSLIKETMKRIFVHMFYAGHVYGASSRAYLMKLGMPAYKIVVKRAIVDPAHFRPACNRAKESKARTLIFVGRLVAEKNLSLLLRALSRLSQEEESPRLRLNIVGAGPTENELKAMAKRLNLDPFVKFQGTVQQSDLPSFYNACDGFVLPSMSEAWGLVVNEAMCCELPVIVSDRCGCAADLVNQDTGWTFSPNNENELLERLNQFLDTPEQVLRRMGSAGRALASQYTADICAEYVLESMSHVCPSAVSAMQEGQ
jgi:glycosyltransferase involved in cell wall biosynthesis